MDINEISKPIAPYLDTFNEVFKKQMKSNVMLLDTVVKYMMKQRGKRLRPMLVLLSASICGGVNDRTHIGATMVELLHTASLVHDDVVDQAAERRGMASINGVWKNKIAVLVGDYLLSRGLLVAVEHEEFEFLRITSHAVRRMSEGELLQIQKSRLLDIDEETYFRIISDKTASLISTCCEIGCFSASSDPADREALRDYGELVGLAFQIRDDVFDYVSRGSLIGKPAGNDVKEKKLTLPLIHSFSQAPKKEAKAILKLIKGKPDKNDVKAVLNFVSEYGGLEYAERKAQELVNQAKSRLQRFNDSEAKTAMLNFADFSIQRAL